MNFKETREMNVERNESLQVYDTENDTWKSIVFFIWIKLEEIEVLQSIFGEDWKCVDQESRVFNVTITDGQAVVLQVMSALIQSHWSGFNWMALIKGGLHQWVSVGRPTGLQNQVNLSIRPPRSASPWCTPYVESAPWLGREAKHYLADELEKLYMYVAFRLKSWVGTEVPCV